MSQLLHSLQSHHPPLSQVKKTILYLFLNPDIQQFFVHIWPHSFLDAINQIIHWHPRQWAPIKAGKAAVYAPKQLLISISSSPRAPRGGHISSKSGSCLQNNDWR